MYPALDENCQNCCAYMTNGLEDETVNIGLELGLDGQRYEFLKSWLLCTFFTLAEQSLVWLQKERMMLKNYLLLLITGVKNQIIV